MFAKKEEIDLILKYYCFKQFSSHGNKTDDFFSFVPFVLRKN